MNLSNENEQSGLENESAISPIIRFWILLTPTLFGILSSFCTIFIIFVNPKYRRSWHYRTIIIQLIAGLIFLLVHIPLYLNYTMLGYVWPKTTAMCQFWWFVGEGYADTMTILMVWALFERHILIFHHQWLTTKRKRILIQYLPLIGLLIYHLTYYTVVSAFPPCENHYNYNEKACSLSCLYRNPILIMYDTIVNDILATLLVPIVSVSLIIRIICRPHSQSHMTDRLKKHRKLVIILVSTSIIYIIFNLPSMILVLANFCGLSEETVKHVKPHVEFLSYYVFIVYPFICVSTVFKQILRHRQRALVVPLNVIKRN